MAQLSRRHVLGLGVGALSAAQFRHAMADNAGAKAHGLSAFGDLKYPPDFHHFDYVNVDAPKGGAFSQLVGSGGSTFNSLNAYIVKGDAANGMNVTFASLMARAFDEPDAVYPLAAEELTVSSDGLVYRFRLRSGIVFHDGTEIGASDVVFSLTTLKTKGHPTFSSVLRDVAEVVVEDKQTVRLRFLPTRGLDAPALAASMPIFSEKYYATRPFDETSLEAPLGSGPYRIARFEQGRFVEFERVKNWWGENLPVSRGQYNFDMLRDEYYRDREVGLEAFIGHNYQFREEFTSRVWATRYDFPAIRDGRVKREVIPDERPSGAQGWLLNTRRDKFGDRRVREAMTIQTEQLVGYPVAGIDLRVLSRSAPPVPLLVVHDQRDRETFHEDSVQLVANWAGPARLVSTDGLGHRRILVDQQVVDEVVSFVRADPGPSGDPSLIDKLSPGVVR